MIISRKTTSSEECCGEFARGIMDIFTESDDSEGDCIEDNNNNNTRRVFRPQINFDCYKSVEGIVTSVQHCNL
uniref:Uncharacterized protein n=1 Tax=Romanomermis culicivorax TaxID=13658 RepID=A0A915JGG2_ROMCU